MCTKKWNWQKIGSIFNPFEHIRPPWMDSYAQSPSVVIHQDYIRVFFTTREPPINNNYISYPAYVDLSKDHLFRVLRISDKPLMTLGKKGCFDEFGIYPFSVIPSPHKVNLLHAYYAGWTRCQSVPFNVSIGYATSNDGGESFSRIYSGPIMPYTEQEPFILSSPRIRFFENKWHLFYIAGESWQIVNGRKEPVYKIRHASSLDQITWEKTNRNIISTVLHRAEAQASPDVFFHEGIYHMFFCYRGIHDYREGLYSYKLGYASSHDLINWKRDDTLIHFTSPSQESDFDFKMQSYPHIFSLDDQIYMLYMGNEFGKFGFGLAKRVD